MILVSSAALSYYSHSRLIFSFLSTSHPFYICSFGVFTIPECPIKKVLSITDALPISDELLHTPTASFHIFDL